MPKPEQIVPEQNCRPRRKGSRTIRDIPEEVLDDLNAGRDQAITLVEWLAIDDRLLLKAAAKDVGLTRSRTKLEEAFAPLMELKITKRMRAIGNVLYQEVSPTQRPTLLANMASHPSNRVRAWALYIIAATPLPLQRRLDQVQPFAADSDAAVRECAWESIRVFLASDIQGAIPALSSWVNHDDSRIRRCAIEGTRPRGVWCPHIVELKQNPSLGLPLLYPVRSDSSRYVQTSVANWLNDASKSQPDWVRELCDQWSVESPTAETRWTTNHALRTLRKAAK